MNKAFGDVTFVNADGVTGEYGFVTDMMVEAVFNENIKNVPDVITRIRGNF